MNWTEQDKRRAAKEGWAFGAGGGVFVNQPNKFTSLFSLYAYLRKRGMTSEWHREVFLSLPWTTAHVDLARREGWGVYCMDPFKVHIRGRFLPGVSASVEDVQQAAEAGDPLAIAAIRFVAKRNLQQ